MTTIFRAYETTQQSSSQSTDDNRETISNDVDLVSYGICDNTVKSKTVVYQASEHVPINMSKTIIFLLDVSGSMSKSERVITSDGSESVTSLDVVRHSTKACIKALSNQDKFCIITYHCSSNVVVEMSDATPDNIESAITRLNELSPSGTTNMVGGIHKAFNEARKVENSDVSILLLTDGQPDNYERKSFIRAVTYWKDYYKQEKFPAPIYGVGFGYDLEVNCLIDVAYETGGQYIYCPDKSLCATVFSNFLANVLCKIPGITTVFDSTNSYKFGSLCVGQRKRIIVYSDDSSNALTVTHDQKALSNNVQVTDDDIKISKACRALIQILDSLVNKHLFCVKVQTANALGDIIAAEDPDGTCDVIQKMVEELNDQAKAAVSSEAEYRRWGHYYLNSLLHSHITQMRVNDRDTSTNMYGSDTIDSKVSDIMMHFTMTPFTKTIEQHRYGYSVPTGYSVPAGYPTDYSVPVAQAVAINSDITTTLSQPTNPCIAGFSSVKIKLERGYKVIPIFALRKGDEILGVGIVECIVRSVNDNIQVRRFGEGAYTDWHPIQNEDEEWTFPALLTPDSIESVDEVFSVLIEKDHNGCRGQSIPIGEYNVITLAHGIDDDSVASHDFYGTEKVVDNLRKLPGWEDGYVTINGVQRGPDDLVCGLY